MPLPITKIPKNIHVTIVGPVAGWEFSFLTIWAKVNTDHTIHVWAPKRLIYQKILYSLLFSERNKITIEKDYPADLAQLRDSIWVKVDRFMGEDAAIESLDIMKSDFSDNVKEAFTSQLTKINAALNQIETSISNAHVHRETSHFEKINSQYIRYSLGFSNTLTIERFIGLYHEYDIGGVYIDKGLMPKLKSKPFLKRSDSLNPISGMAASNEDRKELDRAKIRALLEKMFSDGIITDPAPYFDRYDTILPKEEFNRIKDIIENTSMGDLFHELEEYNLKRSNRHRLFLNKKVNFEDNIFPRSLDASIQPIMVTSRSRNSVLKMILDETRFLHETAENLRKSAISKQELISETREKIENFYRESNVIVSSDNIDKVTTMLTALADYTKGTDDHIIDQLGYEAFERLININLKERPSIQLTDNFLANTPFYNRKSYDPDIDDLQIVPEQPYDKLIILNFSDNSNDKGQSLTKSSNLYKMYLTEKNSVLYDVVKTAPEGRKELKTIKGVPLNKIGRDTKVIITGTLYFPDISNERSSSYSREIVAELTSHLSTAIPQNTVVQSIVFFFDNSAQDIPGFEGTLDASQKDYVIPEVLRELAKEGVFANSAVAVRGSLSASVSQQTAVDPDRPSTSADAPHSELNRIVFTLNEESIVAYQARFGLASLDPRIKFTGTRIEVEHTNTRPKVKDTDTGAKKFLIKVILEHESIEARLKEDLIGVIVRNKPIDASIKENLVATIFEHKSIDSGLKEILVKAILELEFNDDGLEADRVDSSTEGESASDLSEDEVRKSTNDNNPQDPRKDARHYSLHDDFQSAILHGLVAQPATDKVAFVNPDRRETERLEDALRMALRSSSYREWLARYERRFTESNEVNLLEREMNTFQSEEAKNRAFENLKRRIKARSYDIFPLDLTKIKDVAALNALYKNDFNNISVFTNLPSGSCSRRRRSADTGGCEARLRELASALRLLSDANTQLYIRDRTTDIALLDTANDSTLSRLQIFYTDFRRKEGKADLARTRGNHYVIALDNASFTRAQQQTKAGTLSGQPLLLKATPSYGYVLLTPEGRVQSAIAGGEGNQVTVIGQPVRLITRALTTLVKDFTADSHISSLTVSDLPGSDQPSGISALNALKTFITHSPANGKPLAGKLVIEPQSHSNSVFKRLVRDTKRLMPKDRPAIGALVLRSPVTGRPEYWLFPGETKVLIPPRPTGSKALRNLPSSRLSVPVEPKTDTVNSLSAVARERSEFRQRLLDFDTTLKGLKTRHSLPDNIVPMLDTLRRDGQGWRMDFMEPDTLARKNIRFTSAAFKRFQGFLQSAGRPSPSQLKGKKTATGGLERLRSFIGLHDLIAGIAPVGHHYKNTPTQNMTDTERQIHTGRQTLFYAAVTLEGADLTSLGVKGLKLFTPTFKQPFSSRQTAPKLPGTHSGKLSGGLKRAKGLGKKAGHFVPVLGLGVSAGSLTLTVMEYEKEKDPEVKKLMESRVIFESVDTAVSILSDLAGPAGFIIDGIMHFVRGIFNRHYQRQLNKLIYKKLRDASGKAAHIFNPIHAQLDPTSFLAKNQTLNALMSGDGKNLLTLNIKSIDLVNRTLTFGGGFSFPQTFIAGKKNDWAKCKDTTYVKNGPVHECASDINRLEYSTVPFNLIEDALKTLCRTESRLIGYQCTNGVFRNLDQMADKKMILMPSVPEWQVKLLYDQFDQTSRGSAPDSRSPGAKFLDAVGNDKLQRLYQKKVKNIRLTQYRGEHFSSKRTIVYTDKYIGQMFTRTSDFEYLSSRSRLDLDKRNYIIVFSKISAKFTRLLSYDLHSPEGAGNTYLLMSNGGHFIRIHPRGKTASTWVLNYNGPLPYSCLAGGGWKQHCSSRLDQNKKTWTLTLGETRFQFPAPSPDAPYRVIVQNANARFEWLPPDREVDRKVIHRLYDNSELNNSGPRAQKLLRMTAHNTNTAANRFLPLELKQCNTSFLARCMDGAPVQWIRPHGRVVIGFRDVTPGSVSKLNPQWLEYQKYCQKKAEEYLETPYSCFPNKLGLAKADWDKLDRVKLWYDTRHHKEIQLIVPNDRLQPVQGNPTIGYYFFDSINSQVFFRNATALNQGIRHFREFDASEQGAVFGRKVSRTVPGKDDSQLLVFEAPYYYLLTATRSGQLAHRVIAAETLNSQLSAPPIAATDKGLIPFQVVDSYDSRRILRTGFYDGSTQTYIAFLSSLLDGGRLIYEDDGSRLLQISEPVQKQLHKNHLPLHKVVGQQIYYLLFSQHSGNLYYLSTDVNRPAGIQRLSSGLQVIRPAGEQRTVAEMASHRVFSHVQAHSGSLLADTHSGFQLWIPDKAWDNTRVVSENLPVESGPFAHWQLKATGQTVAKSNDTLSVRQFTPRSGVAMTSLNLSKLVNLVFAKVTLDHPGTAWTNASAQVFISDLKGQLRTKVAQARQEFSATVGLLPLPLTTPVTNHTLLSPLRALDFWYLPDDDTLLAAKTGDRFQIMVNEVGQLIALSNTRKKQAFQFFTRPDQGAKGHPFCGKAGAVLTGIPSEFNALLSIPCRYTLPDGIELRGHYQWKPGAGAWHIRTPRAEYLANRKHLALVALDLSLLGPRKASDDPSYRTWLDFNRALRSVPMGVRRRADTRLIALKLRPGYTSTQVAWVEYWGRYSGQQRLLFGLPDKEHGVQQLIGQTTGVWKKNISRNFWFLQPTATVVYSPNHQMLYQITPMGYQSLGTFDRVAVMAEGLLLSGTSGADRISLKALQLDTYYREHQVAFAKEGNRQRFGVVVEGQGGADVIQLDETDLSFFARIILHPGLAEEKTAVHDQAQTRIELNLPAFLFRAKRRDERLVLSTRFTTGDAEIEIQEVWAKMNNHFLQPTTLAFIDLELPLSDLAARVMRSDSDQEVVLPLTVGNRTDRLRFIHATASNPLYIQQEQDRPVKIVTHRAMDGIRLTLEPLNPIHIMRRVFITGTGQWGWEPGSVQVRGPKPESRYRPWPFIPAVISSSATGNRARGNDRNNILYVSANARQWSFPGRGGNDLLLLGMSGNTAARPNVLANWTRSDRCDNRRLEAPGNSSLWQAIVDWTRSLAGGVGHDVYDLRACRPARTIDGHGKHYVLLSSGSKADLRLLSGHNSTALFFTDLTAEQVDFSQCDEQQSNNSSHLAHSNSSLPLGSQTVRIINTHTNQTLALVKTDVLSSLHFKGGQVSLSPMAVINNNESALAVDDSRGGDHGALSFLNRIIRRGQRLVNYLSSLAGGGKDDNDADMAKSEQQEVASLNDTELNQHYQRLVQDLIALSGNRSDGSPSFMSSASQGMIQNLTTPQPLTTISAS